MKKVEGFLTSDGTFHETEAAAEFHEADGALQELSRVHGIDPERLLEAVWDLRNSIRRYLDAKDAVAVLDLSGDFHVEPCPSRLDQLNAASSQDPPDALLNQSPSRG